MTAFDIDEVEPSSSDRRHGFAGLIERARKAEPLSMAVVHPCDEPSLRAAVEAADLGLVLPILIGPSATIEAVAQAAAIDLHRFRIVDADDAEASARRAVALVRGGEAAALMKGSLHSDQFLHAIGAHDTGLTTGRRLSHVYVMDVQRYPTLLLITDGAINIAPTLIDKRDILQNAIDLALLMGIEEPRAAIVCGVETVNPSMPSTLDAAILSKMADRGQIVGGLVDGPLAFDDAVNAAAVRSKGIRSPVAGHANILVVPSLEAGNMLAKQLASLSGAEAAGVVVGARVPIVLVSRADSVRARVTSCAIAVLMANLGGAASSASVKPGQSIGLGDTGMTYASSPMGRLRSEVHGMTGQRDRPHS